MLVTWNQEQPIRIITRPILVKSDRYMFLGFFSFPYIFTVKMPDNGKKNCPSFLEGTFWLISTSQKRGPTMRVFVWVGIDATIAQCPRNKENSELKMCVNNG